MEQRQVAVVVGLLRLAKQPQQGGVEMAGKASHLR
jgi:hypothetical protein